MSTVAVRDLVVRIDDATLLHDVTFDVSASEWLTVIGPNGAGKSTLLRALAGLVAFDGAIAVDDRGVDSLKPRDRARRVALVPQSPVIPPAITVVDYVMLGRTPHIGLLGVESVHDLDVAADVMTLLDLLPLASRRVETLSGGERQRVLLARALAQQAPVLLLDEPTSALDIGHQQEVLELVDRLRVERELTVITTMHDLTLAGRFSDRLLLLASGAVAVIGPRDEVLTESHIERHYGAAVRILHDEDGLVVVPHRAKREAGT